MRSGALRCAAQSTAFGVAGATSVAEFSHFDPKRQPCSMNQR